LDFGGVPDVEPGQYSAATWRINSTSDGHFDVSADPTADGLSLDGIRCQYAENTNEYGRRAIHGCDFVLRDGVTAVPLTVSTPTMFTMRVEDGVPQRPNGGILRVRDVDDMTLSLEAGALPNDMVLLNTYQLGAREDEVVVNLTWDELDSGPGSDDGAWQAPTSAWL
jgi:hypothetical protein